MKVISYCCTKNGNRFYGMKLWHDDVVSFAKFFTESDDSFGELCILRVHETKGNVELSRWQELIN